MRGLPGGNTLQGRDLAKVCGALVEQITLAGVFHPVEGAADRRRADRRDGLKPMRDRDGSGRWVSIVQDPANWSCMHLKKLWNRQKTHCDMLDSFYNK